MNSVDDKDLDAFLNGEDALARRLQALDQPMPPAALDAAILAQAEALMAQEQNEKTQRPAAANDAGAPRAPAHQLRWRVPAGIAASLLAVVLARQGWQSAADDETALVMPAPAPAPAPAKTAAPQPPLDAPAPVPTAPPAQTKPKAQAPAPKPRVIAPAPVQAPAPDAMPASVAEASPPPSPPPSAPALRYSAPPPPAPEPATAAPDQRALSRPQTMRVEVTGSSIGRNASPAQAAPPAPPAPADAAAWLNAIDEMLRAGLQRDALEEWDRFRAAYPDYPVPAETSARIDALKK